MNELAMVPCMVDSRGGKHPPITPIMHEQGCDCHSAFCMLQGAGAASWPVGYGFDFLSFFFFIHKATNE
jgi:hypothetical protein